jgi:hypothetical protein
MASFIFLVPMNIYNHGHSHSTDDYVKFLEEVFKKTINQIGIKVVPSELKPEEKMNNLVSNNKELMEAVSKFDYKEDEHWLSMQLRWYEQNGIKVDRSNGTIELAMTQPRFQGLIGNLFLRHFTISLRAVKKEIDPEVYELITQDLEIMNFFWDNFALNGAKFSHPIFNFIFERVPDPYMAYGNDVNLNKFVRDMLTRYKDNYKDKFFKQQKTI